MAVSQTNSTPADVDILQESPQRLQQLQRLAMLGTLAAGIGHDLRNLIMPMLLRLDAMEASTDLTDYVRGEVNSMKKIVARLQRLAGGLRLLSSDPFRHSIEPQITNLSDWWREITPLIVDALPPRAVLQASVPGGIPAVAIAADALAQVVVNVVMNARRAMEDLPRPLLDVSARLEGNMVRLSITDSGHGMDIETRQRCFEPFFTTGSRDFETGLGLSVARGLMQRFGGELSLEAASGEGTTFVMLIPVVPSVEGATSGKGRRLQLQNGDSQGRRIGDRPVARGLRTMTAHAEQNRFSDANTPAVVPFSVMCIDDNALLIDALERRLELEPGFTGLQRVENLTQSVNEALEKKPSLVLLDIDLPGDIDAFVMLAELVQRLPDTRVVVFTGYPGADLLARSMSGGAWGFLSKGIGSEHLVAALRRVMAGEAVIELDD